MTDTATPARVLLARLDNAHARISKLAKHKSIPEWVSRSIQNTATEAEQQIEILRRLLSSDPRHE